MRVLVLTPSFASYGFLQNMLASMRALGWDVHYASSDFTFGKSIDADAGIEFHTVPFPRGADIKGHLHAAKGLRKLVAEIKPDVIDVHFSAAMLTCAIAKQAGWPPILATIQGLRFPTQQGLRYQIEKRIECWSANRMYSTTVLTNDDYQELLEAGVSSAVLQKAAGFGCDLNKFDIQSVSETEQAEARATANLQLGEKALIFVGRKTAFKGFHRVVEAFSIASKQYPQLRLIVCGNADPLHPTGLSADQERDYLNNTRISDLGWVDDVRALLSISYLNVFPSEREGMPVNLMESLAMGVPVVTYNSRGCRDVVTHESTGVVVDSLSAEALSDAIVSLIRNPEKRAQFSNEALAKRDRFNRRHFVDERIVAFNAAVFSDKPVAI